MSDYSPENLSRKWIGHMSGLLTATREEWERSRPRKTLFSFSPPEADVREDEVTPRADKMALLYRGGVVWALVCRAIFPAYVPGRHAHYGSVVYSVDNHEPDSVFELAQGVNQLRADGAVAPPGTEEIASAIRDDRSSFARLCLPEEVGAHGEAYFANLCLHRKRLPTGYIHDRLLPILIAPKETPWCCILPLRYWAPALRERWIEGPPAYEPTAFANMMAHYKIEP